jgi:hypothetical protein
MVAGALASLQVAFKEISYYLVDVIPQSTDNHFNPLPGEQVRRPRPHTAGHNMGNAVLRQQGGESARRVHGALNVVAPRYLTAFRIDINQDKALAAPPMAALLLGTAANEASSV